MIFNDPRVPRGFFQWCQTSKLDGLLSKCIPVRGQVSQGAKFVTASRILFLDFHQNSCGWCYIC